MSRQAADPSTDGHKGGDYKTADVSEFDLGRVKVNQIQVDLYYNSLIIYQV
jgi:hypothetical protein